MKGVSISAFIDKYHPQKDGKCSVSIRVTYQRKKRFYATGISLDVTEFEKILSAKRRNDADSEIYHKIIALTNKANEAANALPVFTFYKFEEIFLQNRNAADSIFFGFDNYINELKQENRIGTATSYETAKNSFATFRKSLKYADVDKTFLQHYENWMLDREKSRSTVGIYVRSLRTIFNRANIDKSLYPFGNGKGKYAIPISRNIKKALSLEDISKIFYYNARTESEQRAKDYWVFIYLCNGLNVKDLCELKWKNVTDNILSFERSKTKRTKKDVEKIRVSLKQEAKEIIAKWGQPSLSQEAFIFPHLSKGLTATQERKIIQQLTKNNKQVHESYCC